jgi:hypothetical protein
VGPARPFARARVGDFDAKLVRSRARGFAQVEPERTPRALSEQDAVETRPCGNPDGSELELEPPPLQSWRQVERRLVDERPRVEGEAGRRDRAEEALGGAELEDRKRAELIRRRQPQRERGFAVRGDGVHSGAVQVEVGALGTRRKP